MESKELVKTEALDSSVPIKGIPDTKLNTIIVLEFVPWICKLLSLNGQTSAERLDVALPAIKEHCWSMGFSEIKNMFELYADNKLSIEQIPNYLDRILFGKIVTSYKQQLPQRKHLIEKPKLTEEEKLIIVYAGIMNCFEEYQQTGEIPSGYGYAYEHFYALNKFPRHTPHFREKVRQRASMQLAKEKQHQTDVNIKTKCKEIILSDFFDKLIENKTDIKDEL